MTDVVNPSDVVYPADGFALFPDRSVVAMRVNGDLKDLATTVTDDRRRSSRSRSTAPTGSNILRHSAAHVLAQAVQRINPQANLGIGPPITDGFYYDFGVETPVHARRPQGHRQGDAAHRPRGPALRAPRRHRRRGARRARRRAVQARADRPQGRLAKEAAEGASVEVGEGELTIYDNVDPRRRGRLEGPLPRPAPAEHAHDRQRLGRSPASPPPTGAGARRTRSCSASTAPPGRPRTSCAPTSSASRRPPSATTASSARSSTCSRSPRRSARACRSGTRGAASIRGEMEQHARKRHIEGGYTYVYTPHITKEDLFLTVEPPRHVQGGHVPADP